jgi:hypothetical protein
MTACSHARWLKDVLQRKVKTLQECDNCCTVRELPYVVHGC